MDSAALLWHLRKTGRVRSPETTALPLSGGVSSEIWLVMDGSARFVVKRALRKLKVQAEWFADPARNFIEQECLEYLGRIAPGKVPRILFRDPEVSLFGMEFLDERFANWKTTLLEGAIREEDGGPGGRANGYYSSRLLG